MRCNWRMIKAHDKRYHAGGNYLNAADVTAGQHIQWPARVPSVSAKDQPFSRLEASSWPDHLDR